MLRFLAAVIAATIWMVGCDSTDDATLEPGDLVLTLASPGLILETEETFNCANYPLLVDADVEEDRAVIRVEGIGEIDICLTAEGPARATVDVSTTSIPVGYEIVVEKSGRRDRFDYSCGFAGCDLTPLGDPSFTRIGTR